ncbi:MAG: hypothetical protein NTW51_17070 [Cyanobacteria bacterium]|nr:hypothetical protein [Cyanobacteriota bacterium]
MAGIGSLAFATLTPQATFAVPAITLKGSFDGPNGSRPSAALTSDGNGKFYGTTQIGGANGVGGIFEFDPSGSGSITLKGSFDNANGSGPVAALTSAGNGKFYGTTPFGGDNGGGGIFEFDPSGSGSITLKSSFSIGGANGAYPIAALTPAGNGNFYGITPNYSTNSNGVEENYYGTIFEFDPSGSGSITLKSSFSYDTLYGTTPVAALTSAGNGKFYGTIAGAINDYGTIFEFDPSGSGSITFEDSFRFDGANGAYPYAALTSAGNGKFYGTTPFGGDNGGGGIFEFVPSGSGSITLKSSFSIGGANGAYPIAALTPAGNGKFYGTTSEGGMNNTGFIFEFDPGADSVPTPAPLPLMGAGAAFGWSRRLRRRIQAVRPVFPVGL